MILAIKHVPFSMLSDYGRIHTVTEVRYETIYWTKATHYYAEVSTELPDGTILCCQSVLMVCMYDDRLLEKTRCTQF